MAGDHWSCLCVLSLVVCSRIFKTGTESDYTSSIRKWFSIGEVEKGENVKTECDKLLLVKPAICPGEDVCMVLRSKLFA